MAEELKLNANSKSFVYGKLSELIDSSGKSYRVTVKEWSEHRSVSANAQQHVWYKQIAEIDGETVKQVELRCKLEHGLPILLADKDIGPKLVWTLDKVGFFDLPYEKQVNFMEVLAVTSLMSTKQHNKFRDDMQFHYNKNGYKLDYL